jgi:hypothetical protein
MRTELESMAAMLIVMIGSVLVMLILVAGIVVKYQIQMPAMLYHSHLVPMAVIHDPSR